MGVIRLGTENENLPGFVTISPPLQNGGPANYGSAFLPAVYQGTPINSGFRPFAGPGPGAGASVSNIRNPRQSSEAQRLQLDFIQSLNREVLERNPHHEGVEGTIESFELAFRMPKELPQLMDLANESAATKALYGSGEQATENFGRQCLLARRFVESVQRGLRSGFYRQGQLILSRENGIQHFQKLVYSALTEEL